MACSERGQSPRRSASPSLEEWPARVAGDRTEVTQVSWMWLNIPLMVLVVLAVAGIPLWLVLTRPEYSGRPDGSALDAEMHAQRLVELAKQGRRQMADRSANALHGDGSDLLRLRLGVPPEAGRAAW